MYTIMVLIVHLLVIKKINWEKFGAFCCDVTSGMTS